MRVDFKGAAIDREAMAAALLEAGATRVQVTSWGVLFYARGLFAGELRDGVLSIRAGMISEGAVRRAYSAQVVARGAQRLGWKVERQGEKISLTRR
jgi:hypothetical protein